MYQAILHGKYRGIDRGQQNESAEDDISYRDLYSGMEDFLTAGVFTRLSYLDSRYLWEILGKTFKLELLSPPLSPPGALKNIQFWPSWRYGENMRRVEPDVFLEFENMNIIVEAKFGDEGNPQDKEQLEREWKGMRNVNDNEQARKDTWLFAIGGISDNDYFTGWEGEIRKNNSHFKFASAGWQDLYDVLEKEPSREDKCYERIIKDIVSILEFHGYRTPVWMKELSDKICEHDLCINDVSLPLFC